MEATVEGKARSHRLKAETAADHRDLDSRILGAAPFSSRERYVGFLRVQEAFHRAIDALYTDPLLVQAIPSLEARQRIGSIRADLADLGEQPSSASPLMLPDMDTAEAVGWLYVAEGSKLGAAFLSKAAAKLGLSDGFGARHLAAAPEGRAEHWRGFTASLDGYALPPEAEDRVRDGARDAFRFYAALAERQFGAGADRGV